MYYYLLLFGWVSLFRIEIMSVAIVISYVDILKKYTVTVMALGVAPYILGPWWALEIYEIQN